MKLYLAAAYERRAELLDYGRDLIGMGHAITSTWLGLDNADLEAAILEDHHAEIAAAIAEKNWNQILEADAFVMFTGGKGRGGRHIETGIAFGRAVERGMRLWIVGPPENAFHRHPCVGVFSDWPTFRTYAAVIARAGV